MPLRDHAPWFRSKGEGEGEPLSYRTWKRFGQLRGRRGWKSNLIDGIDESSWDLLIILDACRYDTLVDVADCAAVEPRISPATATKGFLATARRRGVFDGKTYVSANPQSGKHSPGSVAHVPVYDEQWDDTLLTVPPGPVYDRAQEELSAGNQVVAHTVQPHYPHICEVADRVRPVANGLHPNEMGTGSGFQIQGALARGTVDLERSRQSYRAAVRFAWERARDISVELADAGHTVVITADHGELFGEWGFVEHPTDVPVRDLIRVPWTVFRPATSESDRPSDRLAALGYVER